tara:strand:+ start:113 stop:292 length:180 start_codon:yes stop_codon:yes gene_type:complete
MPPDKMDRNIKYIIQREREREGESNIYPRQLLSALVGGQVEPLEIILHLEGDILPLAVL